MKKIIIMLITLSLILQIGCTKPNNPIVESETGDDISSIAVGGGDQEIVTRSEKIANSIVELYGIDDSVAVVFNDIAIVGIVLSYDQLLDEDLRDMINFRVKEVDSLITQVKITQKPKNFKQLNQIIIGLLNGTPYDSYVEEINKLAEKINKEK